MRTWIYDPVEKRLQSGDRSVGLTNKAAAVLEVLLGRSGEVVSRDEIIDHVWEGTTVTPDLVREYVFDLRQALGDEASNPSYIETVRGRGLRLLGGIVSEAGPAAERPRCKPRIVVLTPEIFGGGDRWQSLAIPLLREINVDLSRYGDLTVIAQIRGETRDADSPVELAEKLGADFLVLITLAVTSDTLSASFQLLDGATGGICSTDRLERSVGELPHVTADVAARISNALGRFRGAVHDAVLIAYRRRPAGSRSAYEEYLLSVSCEHQDSLDAWRAGLAHADRAIALDPTFARAWHMRATMLRGLVNFFFDPELDRDIAFREAALARRKSVELDPRDPHILAWSAELHVAEGNLATARDTLFRAVDLGRRQPDTLSYCATAFFLHLALYKEAVELIDEALRLSPRPPVWYRMVECRAAFFAGDHARCVAAADACPGSLPGLLFSALSLAASERNAEARQRYSEFLSRYPSFTPEAYAANMMSHKLTAHRFLDAVARLEEQSSSAAYN